MDFGVSELGDFEDIGDGSSEMRYRDRIEWFAEDEKPHPRLRHGTYWLLHNCIAHPLLAVVPNQPAVEFHELTSQWLNHRHPDPVVTYAKWAEGKRKRQLVTTLPKITNRLLWVLHNAVAHPLIGVLPTKATFKFHDWSAKKMNVKGWV